MVHAAGFQIGMETATINAKGDRVLVKSWSIDSRSFR